MAWDKLSVTALGTLIAKTFTAAVATNITAATKAAAGVVTSTAHGLVTGDLALIMAVGGMTQIIGVFPVTKVDADSFSIPVNTTAATTYTSGGTVQKLTGSLVGDLTPDQLRQLLDACDRVKSQPGVSLASQFAGVTP